MAWVGFDSERLKSPQSGLGKFCEYLGKALVEECDVDIQFFQKQKTARIFPSPAQYGKIYDHNKFLGVSTGVDVWHCTHQTSPYLPADHSIPIVTTIHDLNFLHGSNSESKIKRKLAKVQRLIDRSSAVVFISQFTADEVSKHLELGNRYTEVIYNAPALPNVENVFVPILNTRPYFFSIGLISEKKNFHKLVSLLHAYPNHELIIAGNRTDDYALKILKVAEKLGVADRLILPGEITETEKVNYYNNCEAFLMPSLAEGFCLPVIEAMHFGKPIFLSMAGALPEIGGKDAFYFTSFDGSEMAEVVRGGLLQFQEDGLKRERMQAHAAQFSWKKAAKAYCDVYNRCIKR